MNPSKPLHILYHHRTQGRGAEGVHIVSIVHALQRLGHRVTVLSPAGIDPLASAGDAPVDKSTVATSGVQSLWKWISKHLPNALFELAEIAYNIPARRRLEDALRKGKFDLVYERYAFYLTAGAKAAKRHGIPFVLEANEVSGIKDRARPQTFLRLCNRFERKLFEHCTAILTVSSHLRNMILQRGGITPDRVEVVPNAVEVEKFLAISRDPQLTAKLGLDGAKVLAVCGWFDKWDRLDFLIDALAKLAPQFPQAKLLVVGDGPVLPKARERAIQAGVSSRIVFAGAVARRDVLHYLAQADIALIPHSNDFGSPVVMFEFMGLGAAVVAPRLAPIEDVHVHGETALLFKPLDLEGFVAQIAVLLQDESVRSGIAKRAKAVLFERHTWDKNAEQILTSALEKPE